MTICWTRVKRDPSAGTNDYILAWARSCLWGMWLGGVDLPIESRTTAGLGTANPAPLVDCKLSAMLIGEQLVGASPGVTSWYHGPANAE